MHHTSRYRRSTFALLRDWTPFVLGAALLRAARRFVRLPAIGHLGGPVLASTGFHTVLLVILGMLVVAAERPEPVGAPLAVGLMPNSAGDGGLDGSPITVDAASGAGRSEAAAASDERKLSAAALAFDHGAGAPSDGGLLELGLDNPLDMLAPHAAGATARAAKGSAAARNGKPRGKSSARLAGKNGAAGGKPGSGSGGSSFFGLASSGNKVVFVVDVSGSMHGRRIRRAQTELRHTLEALSPAQQFFVVFFSDGALPMPASSLVTASRDNVAQAWQFVRQIECGGGTNPLPALLLALELKPDAVYLLTDGKFPPQVVWALAEAQPSRRIPIYTIGFATKKAERLLKAIADDTGGSYRFVP